MTRSTLDRSIIITAVLANCLLSPAAHARPTELVEPDPVTINCSLPEDKMVKGVRTGGAVRGWVVVKQTPNNTELKYIKGANKHIIIVNVSYTMNKFAITYKDSTNLNYKVENNGVRRIHPRPITWMENLSNDIQLSTNNLCNE